MNTTTLAAPPPPAEPPGKVDRLIEAAKRIDYLDDHEKAVVMVKCAHSNWLSVAGLETVYGLFDELGDAVANRALLLLADQPPTPQDRRIARLVWEITHEPGDTPARWAERLVTTWPDAFRAKDSGIAVGGAT